MIHVHKYEQDGFTLIELLVAITIFAIVSVVVGGGLLGYIREARIARVKSDLSILQSAIDEYKFMFGRYPAQLKDLVRPPADEKDKVKWPKEGLLKKKELPEDQWDNKYQYKLNPANAEHAYELYSYGPNGKEAPKGEWIDVWTMTLKS